MPAPRELVDLYLHLARASEEQRRPLQRDKFLVLAASVATGAGSTEVAEECRSRILHSNPNHMLKSFGTMAEALSCEDVRHYSQQLLRLYPFEKAEYLLHKFLAGGYSGRHGYTEMIEKMSAPPTAERPVNDEVSGGPRQELARHSPVSGINRPAPSQARPIPAKKEPSIHVGRPHFSPTTMTGLPVPSTDRVDVCSWARWLTWTIVAFAAGLVVGGAFVHFLLPPG